MMRRRVGPRLGPRSGTVMISWAAGGAGVWREEPTARKAGQLHSGQHETSFGISCSCPFAARRRNACLGHKAASRLRSRYCWQASPTRQTVSCFVSRELGSSNGGSGCVGGHLRDFCVTWNAGSSVRFFPARASQGRACAATRLPDHQPPRRGKLRATANA